MYKRQGKRKDHFDAGFDMNYAWDLMEAMRDVFVNDSIAARLLEVDWSEYDSIPAVSYTHLVDGRWQIALRPSTNRLTVVRR